MSLKKRKNWAGRNLINYNMEKVIELCAKRPKHKDLTILFYNTPLGRESLEKTKRNLVRRGYSVTTKSYWNIFVSFVDNQYICHTMKPFIKKAFAVCLFLVLVWIAVALWLFAPELGERFHCMSSVWECLSIIVGICGLSLYCFTHEDADARN